jgi:hypothetical protein
MNLAMKIEQFESPNVWFRDIKKNILMDGNFTKLIYVHEWMTLIGIVLQIPIRINIIEHIMGKKYIYYQCDLMEKLCGIERDILETYQQMFHCSYKTPVFKLQTQIGKKKYLSFPLNSVWSMGSKDWRENTEQVFCIKLIGVWETASEIGLMYKMIFG